MQVDFSREEATVLLMVLNEHPVRGLSNQAACVSIANKVSVAMNASVKPPAEKPPAPPEGKA